MFELLKKELLEDHERQLKNTKFYIENGFCESWSDEHKKYSDNGIRKYSTETRWNQYQSGKIDREKAVSFAIKREEKNKEKQLEAKLEKLAKVAEAPDLEIVSVYVDFIKSSTWGYNPKAKTYSNNKSCTGFASGCGYDKESAAVAEAFNNDFSLLKVLYTLKENGLKDGLSDKSKSACTGVDNRNIVGYGAGYSVLPYFEGGVGVGCFWRILEKAGYKVKATYGRNENTYIITNEA